MQIDIYGFREPPFLMTPDARLFFPSTVHSRAYAHLMYGLAQGEGFVVVTGEVGAGKTTLIERLCAELDPATYVVARIATTQVQGDDLLRLVADAFGAQPDGDKAAVLRSIMAALRNSPRKHVLIVDEAQALNHSALEELRMLSNVTDGKRALLQTILLGQPQLRKLIASPDLDQLRQRILASFHLGGLSEPEVRSYVEHRMRAVGWAGNPSWDDQAFGVLHRHTGGIPRRINRLCSRVLLAGALEHAPHLTAALVEATASELDEDLGAGAEEMPAVAAPRGLAVGLPMGAAAQLEDLAQRVEALEQNAARRERVLNRLMDLFAETSGDRR
ncbi:AAA family ATPase [Paracraurococcus ruber]|uniref:ATPase n=1 Tax=Paracraurococcus ruber TaxID=77675 RepID=A0ABS1CT96_9PROT|nr:AAA family ATPase [Paracraurococcus ruber]MBK1657573.1 ATPase [Paracraurococcus ruber]TDG32091.1 AAA family ATPase [Paracraurococcus ruber]